MAKIKLKMPKLAVSMQEGTILEWFVQDGDDVERGQKIYSIESEKAVMDVESPFAGKITLLVGTGSAMKVGTPIAEINT